MEARGKLDEANENPPPRTTNPIVVEIHLWISEVAYLDAQRKAHQKGSLRQAVSSLKAVGANVLGTVTN